MGVERVYKGFEKPLVRTAPIFYCVGRGGLAKCATKRGRAHFFNAPHVQHG